MILSKGQLGDYPFEYEEYAGMCMPLFNGY